MGFFRHDTNTFLTILDLSQRIKPNSRLLVAAEDAFFAAAAEVSFSLVAVEVAARSPKTRRGVVQGSVHDGATTPERQFLLGKRLEQTTAQRRKRDRAKSNRTMCITIERMNQRKPPKKAFKIIKKDGFARFSEFSIDSSIF